MQEIVGSPPSPEVSMQREFITNPPLWAERVARVELDEWQGDALMKLAQTRRVAVRSGSGSGKTFLEAIAILWFLATRPFAKIPVTAPTMHQLGNILWSELASIISRSPILSALLVWRKTKIEVRGHEDTWFAVARTAGKRSAQSHEQFTVESLQGFHGKNICAVVDEGSGVINEVYNAFEGIFTDKEAFSLIASNPTRLRGGFYDAFHIDANLWTRIHIDATKQPRVSPHYLERMLRHGKDSMLYRAKVLGEFPLSDTNCLVLPDFIQAAAGLRSPERSEASACISMSLDVGRVKDPSYIARLYEHPGNEYSAEFRRIESPITAGALATLVTQEVVVHKPRYGLFVDAIGIGSGVVDELMLRIPKKKLSPIKVNEVALAPEEFVNRRAELLWELRTRFEQELLGIPLEYVETLLEELTDLTYDLDIHDRIRVESKDAWKARHSGRSPNVSDALYLSVVPLCGLAIKGKEIQRKRGMESQLGLTAGLVHKVAGPRMLYSANGRFHPTYKRVLPADF